MDSWGLEEIHCHNKLANIVVYVTVLVLADGGGGGGEDGRHIVKFICGVVAYGHYCQGMPGGGE